jgi:signal transduction histidine kinase
VGDDLKPDDPHKELMKEILGQVRRLDRTVQGLLAFARPTTPRKEPIVLRSFIERIARVAGVHKLGPGIRIRQEGPVDLEVAADPALLEQVLWNLLLNAAEAMKGTGEILVAYQAAAQGVDLTVADSGGGIPSEVRDKLFRPFATTKTTGTGLGLSLCRKIVEAHRGTIEISSTGGQGTTVHVRLPAQ